MRTGVLGLYSPGRSVLHRMPAGAKLAGLGVGLFVLAFYRSGLTVAIGAFLVAFATAVSGVPLRLVGAQIRPVLWIAAAIAAVQLWASDWQHTLVVVGTLFTAISAAGLVTLTTRTEDLVGALVVALRPLRRFGFDPDRAALTLTLAVRIIPVLAGLVDDVREARRARGAERSPRALAVPVVVRTVRYADRLGEALAARGLDDD